MRGVSFVLCRLAGLFGAILLIPLAMALLVDHHGPRVAWSFAIPVIISAVLLLISIWIARAGRPQLNAPAQGFLCVVLGWTLFAALGAMPFWISGVLPTFVDAFFEAMSGVTTTGASTFTSVADVPDVLLLWRSMTQFVGGIGIIALFVAVLPALGAGGVVLFRSEAVSVVLEERLRPKIRDTAKILWMIYLGLTLVQTVLLMLCGMSLFDAICHSMTTMSTGGFSTNDLSMGAYSAGAQWVTIAFMFLGGVSFVLHGKALRGELRTCYRQNEEFVLYSWVALISTVVIALVLMLSVEPAALTEVPHPLDPVLQDDGLMTRLRHSMFQVLSIMTTTGFASSDYDRWPDVCRFLLVALMFIGGCSGSTAGGIKCFRFLLLYRAFGRQLVHLLHPTRVMSVRMGGSAVSEEAVRSAAILFAAMVLVTALGAFLLLLLGVPMTEAVSGTAACIMCIGPALGDVGPTGNYADLPMLAKAILSVLMLVGRLELYAVMVLIGMVVRRK